MPKQKYRISFPFCDTVDHNRCGHKAVKLTVRVTHCPLLMQIYLSEQYPIKCIHIGWSLINHLLTLKREISKIVIKVWPGRLNYLLLFIQQQTEKLFSTKLVVLTCEFRSSRRSFNERQREIERERRRRDREDIVDRKAEV